MRKNLRDMSLEELWGLFPIELCPHNAAWSVRAKEEISLLSNILEEFKPAIHHIGSTAIPGIYAKPIIDILVELPPEMDFLPVREALETTGYICMARSSRRMSFNKGYTPAGYDEKVFHIHIHRQGDNAEIYFRDFLIAHPETAKEYEKLKLSLLPRFKHDRDGYTRAKTEFVNRISDPEPT